jgi:hypothetical protein
MTAMASTQSLYIVHHNGDAFGSQTGRVRGVFSTRNLAIGAVETVTRTHEASYSQPNILEYVVRDGNIKVITAHFSDTVASGVTVYVAIDLATSQIVEAKPFSTHDEAWAACEGFKAVRGGDEWVGERSWTGARGLRHGSGV